MYKAEIEYRAYEDVYEDGENIQCDNVWNETLVADTSGELREKVLDATYSRWQDLDGEQINEYDWCTEYHTSYLATEDNNGEASNTAVNLWRRGKLRLWAIHCHILVTEMTEQKASL
jgi:hypothetical protein